MFFDMHVPYSVLYTEHTANLILLNHKLAQNFQPGCNCVFIISAMWTDEHSEKSLDISSC